MKTIDKLAELFCKVDAISKQLSSITSIWSFGWEPRITYNKVKERHLRMYCEEKHMYLSLDIYWELTSWVLHNPRLSVTLDNTKDFQDQDEKTLEAILTFLTKQND
jgi:hypothetical protein